MTIVRVVALWRAAPGSADEVREILRDLATRSEAEPGCLSFTVLEAVEQTGRFVLVEEYAGDAGRQAHLDSPHFQRLVLDRAVPLLTEREIDVFEAVHMGSRMSGRNSA